MNGEVISPANGLSLLGNMDVVEPLAVVGISLKYPQDATSPERFWNMMEERRCAMTEWPRDRVNIDAFYNQEQASKSEIPARGAHFLQEDLGLFDASFFAMNTKEASAVDPQARILLETCYRALENAGMPMEHVHGSRTGVYTGSMSDAYKLLLVRDSDDFPQYAATGVAVNMLANRISWFFNFTGPSINLDSACSSSLMALDIACQGLRQGECDMALVAGTNILLGVETPLSLAKMGFISPSSRCYSFDERADGYSRGEGLGVVVVKRLHDALRHNDTIRAVIRATGSNQDGRTPGLTQPNGESQAQLIRDTYAKADLSFAHTRFVEAHGTGTAIGDPTEANAIGRGNIGHLEGGSGIAGVIKAILCLEKGLIPPNANFEQINSRIQAKALNLEFPTSLTTWPECDIRRASVSSFGFGGSNSHVVLDDAYNFLRKRALRGHNTTYHHRIRMNHSKDSDGRCNSGMNGYANGHIDTTTRRKLTLLVWSAADEHSAGILVEKASHFQAQTDPSTLDDVAYTLGFRRSLLPWRSFAVVSSTESSACLGGAGTRISKPIRSRMKRGLAFIFTGQGAQYRGMGRGLLQYPVFKKTLGLIDNLMRTFGCCVSFLDVISSDSKDVNIDSPEVSQPLCTAIQIALLHLLKSFGIVPSTVVGHSSGEIAAAYACGGLSLESACKVAYLRGKHVCNASQPCRRGAMLAVGMSEQDYKAFLHRHSLGHIGQELPVACINSPKNITLSGCEDLVNSIHALFSDYDIFSRKLKTGAAYHSPWMKESANLYCSALGDLLPGEALHEGIEMLSSVTRDSIDSTTAKTYFGSEYWAQNMMKPVQFSGALTDLLRRNRSSRATGSTSIVVSDLVEVGPHSTLQRAVNEILDHASISNVQYQSCLSRFDQSSRPLLELAGRLHCAGYPIQLNNVNQMENMSTYKCLTDLPEYPFNHSTRYWHESRLSKNLCLRQHPPLHLLGTLSPESTNLESRWRKFLSIAEMPWLRDHQINGKIVFPGAGMLVMAGEAVSQTRRSHRKTTGFFVKESAISNPIIIPPNEEERVEVVTYARPIQNSSNKDHDDVHVRICVEEGGVWVEACAALIQVHYEPPEEEVDNGREQKLRTHECNRIYTNAKQRCHQKVDPRTLYQHFAKMGMQYGPTFQALRNVYWDGHQTAIAEMSLQFPEELRSAGYGSLTHKIHPTLLDAITHLPWVALTKGATQVQPTGVPSKMRGCWASSSGLTTSPSTTLRAFSTTAFKGHRGTLSSMFVLDEDDNVVMSFDHMETTAVSSADSHLSEFSKRRRLCWEMSWKCDPSLLAPNQLNRLLQFHLVDVGDREVFFPRMTQMCRIFINGTLGKISGNDIDEARPHIKRYMKWMKAQQAMWREGNVAELKKTPVQEEIGAEEFDTLVRWVEAENPTGRLFATVGRNLPAIIQGDVDPLELLFDKETQLAENYYADSMRSSAFVPPLRCYIDMLAHKNQAMKILEVGAGTGSMTAHILSSVFYGPEEADRKHLAPRLASYDYTDISPYFFDKAKSRFAATELDFIRFSTLDIEQDPVDQGFQPGTYDMVVASAVLHATRDLEETLRHVHRLLKPGGKLVFAEIVQPEILRAGFAFGLLPGWWRGLEEYRDMSACISRERWNDLLMQAGFGGIDIYFRDHESDISHEYGVMVATATEDKETGNSHDIVILKDDDCELAAELISALQEHFIGSSVLTPEQVGNANFSEETCIISLLDVEKPHLQDLTERKFERLKSIFAASKRMIWVSNYDPDARDSPYYAMVNGLMRVLRSEDSSRILMTLSRTGSLDPAKLASSIHKILTTPNFGEMGDIEYWERDGIIEVPRIKEASAINDDLGSRLKPQLHHLGFNNCGPLALEVAVPGALDSLRWVKDPVHALEIGSDEVEIQIRAVGLNFRDIFIALGRLDEDTDLGYECAGIVSRVGTNCKDLQPGDPVCVPTSPCLKSYARCHHRLPIKIADGVSFEEAAALPVTGVTAYYSLVEQARLQKDDTILIHAGAGGTGQMAIQIAQLVGAEVFVTVGSQEKKQLVMVRYKIPEDHVFYSRNKSFAEGIRRMTQNRGVDVVLNSLSGDLLTTTWELMAPGGRFIEIGKRDIEANSKLPMEQFRRNVSFCAVSIDRLSPVKMRNVFVEVMKMVGDGRLKHPHPLHVYSIGNIEQAFRFIQSGKNSGKVVLNMTSSDTVPVLLKYEPHYQFDPNASYVIAGGLGGLGRSAARWMTERGARNLILLSRSGPKSQSAKDLIRDLEAQGKQVEALPCDVACRSTLSSTLSQCLQKLPPIKGCIQGTMVLKDALFENMSFLEWEQAIAAKVQSSLNLHEVLPRDLDFFVMLSSMAGIIGSIGQANYASGNTFQNGLARYRRRIGEKAAALDLGWMADVGILAEKEEYRRGREGIVDTIEIHETEFHALLDYYCDPALEVCYDADVQPIIGLAPTAELRHQGYEPPAAMNTPTFAILDQIDRDSLSAVGVDAQAHSSTEDFFRATTDEEASAVVISALLKKLEKTFSIPVDDSATSKALSAYGVDSLLAIEIKSWVSREFMSDIAVFDIMGGASIEQVGDLVTEKCKARKSGRTS
ncbi:BcPKS1, polyketide synthase [Lindgomyces ingoldianus]|uniref:BcPKS1, polyketide synthase n=1 Tax=Lindgomyces ingoldianus TaxID=673940 RepID=A0ACB6QG27_9PLEO|nr:BcPKS1, polyketide synthase [Lindgomyces ingoldianus]KAF2465949.1 BcPKS1, polyketide synthase [Lindgomyces ingoldianus]